MLKTMQRNRILRKQKTMQRNRILRKQFRIDRGCLVIQIPKSLIQPSLFC